MFPVGEISRVLRACRYAALQRPSGIACKYARPRELARQWSTLDGLQFIDDLWTYNAGLASQMLARLPSQHHGSAQAASSDLPLAPAALDILLAGGLTSDFADAARVLVALTTAAPVAAALDDQLHTRRARASYILGRLHAIGGYVTTGDLTVYDGGDIVSRATERCRFRARIRLRKQQEYRVFLSSLSTAFSPTLAAAAALLLALAPTKPPRSPARALAAVEREHGCDATVACARQARACKSIKSVRVLTTLGFGCYQARVYCKGRLAL
ncbi:hypothetical protein B0H15DRAFT_951279 [Mycena belliarum]|uniref:Uncharacterized protein n=1 Tax=Mycena belliarum TaxID=1033014 RepID=A0AAD6XKF1_9AGAR|nr:hypothetical protein B0H15DRAFT_951279 [Mycena belliae]